MKDVVKYKNAKPSHAEGKFCIEMKDPITGKVKERINDTNHVFEDALFVSNWITYMSGAYLVLTDSDAEIDPNLPFILGETIGCGMPSQSGSGLYQGTYNANNQVLAEKTFESTRWKFQYDFLTTQAIGEIKTIGLTNQFRGIANVRPDGFLPPNTSNSYSFSISDGRYSYNCSTSGVVSKWDNYTGTEVTTDISSVVGTTTNQFKYVGYAPITKKMYVWVYIERKMYVFTDNTFSTLETVYTADEVNISAECFYVYNNIAYFLQSNRLYFVDFINNSYTEGNIPSAKVWGNTHYHGTGTIPYGKYIISFGNTISSSILTKLIYNMETQQAAGYTVASRSNYPAVYHPYTDSKLPVLTNNMTYNHAVCAKKLNEPVPKTAENAMTVTYELDVYW